MHFSIRRLPAGLAVCLIASALPLAQSTAPQGQDQRPRFRTEANYVRVDVYPTRNGVPVTDLTVTDFEVLEDGAPQKIEAFEHVTIRSGGAQTERTDPGSQRDMLQAAANPRNRVFVIFLDTANVSISGAHTINEPLIRLIDRILGPDDLVGVMTPEMSASQLVLGRKTEVIETGLRRNWPWGRRDSLQLDQKEREYELCYPLFSRESGTRSAIAQAMIDRKRERATLEALEDLVRYLYAIREERKAILTVTEGWLLYRPDDSMQTLRSDPATGERDPVPGREPIRVGPDGRITTTRDGSSGGNVDKAACDADRLRLSSMDNERYFRDILDEANRANASFYPIDPRGLPVFDSSIGPEKPPPPAVDARILATRQDSMHVLALNTDGMAVMNSNSLDAGLKRISDDLTSYYLLGYYSSNPKLDGGFRSLKVRVKRPAVDVRARRGYRAATAEEVTAAKTGAAAPAASATDTVAAAIASAGRSRPGQQLLVNAAAMRRSGQVHRVWVEGELQPDRGSTLQWSQGATVDVQITSGSASAVGRATLKPGERTFLVAVDLPGALDPAGIDVQVRAASADRTSPPLTDGVRITPAPRPVIFRAGPATANRPLPAGDVTFSRTERAHFELPIDGEGTPSAARLLDRNGQPLAIPVQVGERTDPSGQRWITADVALAPLAPGDYAVEMGVRTAAGDERVIAALRVTR